MKVPKAPPGSEPKLVYSKDKTKTRRTVKGAAGGMLGVDYEDPRIKDPTTVKATTGAGENVDTPGAQKGEALPTPGGHEGPMEEKRVSAPKEEAEMVLDDEDANTRDMKAKQRGRGLVSRDRMTVDKDAPQLLRRKRPWEEDEEEEERRQEDPEELDLSAIGEQIASAGDQNPVHTATVGDPRLVDPHAIMTAFGTPVAYAKHCMVLAEAFRRFTGATRAETIAYLAKLFVGLGDRGFARQALRELGPATGIIDIYPLEVLQHVMETYPGLLRRVGFGRLFMQRRLTLAAGVPASLTYPDWLKIRGFAIEGGGRVGYRFEPAEEEGVYLLRIDAPGLYRLLVSGATRSGHTVLDRLEAQVDSSDHALPRVPEPEPVRDQVRLAAWPQPSPIPIDYRQALEEPRAARARSGISSGELIARQQQAHLALEREEAVDFVDAKEPLEEAVEVVEDALSRAEASLLKLAVALSTEAGDFTPVESSTVEITVNEPAYRPPEE